MSPEETQPSETDVEQDKMAGCSQTEGNIGRVWYKCVRCHQAFDEKAKLFTHSASFCFVLHLVLKENSGGVPKGTEKQESTKPNIGNETQRSHAIEQNSAVPKEPSQVTNLQIHREVKTPSICPICNKQLANELLGRHIRVHTGELPFACTKCSLTFSQSCSLSRHLLTHKKGEKLLDCDQCDNRYRSVRDLNRHLKLHYLTGDVAKETLLRCRVCSLEYRTKRGLREHEKIHGPLSKDFFGSDSDETGALSTVRTVKKTALIQSRRKRRKTTVKFYAEQTLSSSSDEENFPNKRKSDDRKRKKTNCIKPGTFLLQKSVDKVPPSIEDSRKESEENRERNLPRDWCRTGITDDQHGPSTKDKLFNSFLNFNDKEKNESSLQLNESTSNQIPLPGFKEIPRNLLAERESESNCPLHITHYMSTDPTSSSLDDNSGKPICDTLETVDNLNTLESNPSSHSSNSENIENPTYPMIKCNVCLLPYKQTIQSYHDHMAAHHSCGGSNRRGPAANDFIRKGLILPNILRDSDNLNNRKPDQSRKKTKLGGVKRQPAAKYSSSEGELSYESDVTSEPSTDASSLCMGSEFDSESTYHSEVDSDATYPYGIDSSLEEEEEEEEAVDVFHYIPNAPISRDHSHSLHLNHTRRTKGAQDSIVQDRPQFTSNINKEDRFKRKFAKVVLVKLNLKDIEEFGWIVPKEEETDNTLESCHQIKSNFGKTLTSEDVEECKPDVTDIQGGGKAIPCNVNETKDSQLPLTDFEHTSEDAERKLLDSNNVNDEGFRLDGGESLKILSATNSTQIYQTSVSAPVKNEKETINQSINEITSAFNSPSIMFDHSIAGQSSHVRSDLTKTTETLNGENDENNNLHDIDTSELSDDRPCYRLKTEPVTDDEVSQSSGQQRGHFDDYEDAGYGFDVKKEPAPEADTLNYDIYRFPFHEAEIVAQQDDHTNTWLKAEPLTYDEDNQSNLCQLEFCMVSTKIAS